VVTANTAWLAGWLGSEAQVAFAKELAGLGGELVGSAC
jgi:hypothetical protein